jgi:hypothetical protein
MKHLQHAYVTLETYAFSETSSCCLSESRFIDAELDTGTKFDAMEVASAELIGDADLGGAEPAGGSVRRAQRRGVDVGDDTGFSSGSTRGVCQWRAESGWGMAVTCARRVAT